MTPSLQRFVLYLAIGVGTFLLDLGMLYAAVSVFGFAYYIVTPISFLIAVSLNYFLSRHFVFMGTDRSMHSGYAYFISVAIVGALITTGLVAGLVSLLGIYYLYARIVVAGIVGIINYLFNLFLNFKVAGKHTF